MLVIQKMLKNGLNYTMLEKEQNLQEEGSGKLFIKRCLNQKVRQFLENII